VLGPLFRTAGHTVRTQHGITASAGQRRCYGELCNYLQACDSAGCWSLGLVFDLSMTMTILGSAIGNTILTSRTFLFSPRCQHCAQAHACTASFCVFFFYRPTGRLRLTSLPLECDHNATNQTRFVSSAQHSTRAPLRKVPWGRCPGCWCGGLYHQNTQTLAD
jgi:hypothetical protein